MKYRKMDPDYKALWLKALRSGDYEQTIGALRKATENGKEGFCCLGVVCDLGVKRGVGEWLISPDGNLRSVFQHDGLSRQVSLPGNFRDLLRISMQAESALIERNDGMHWTFAQIADWIEANL